VCMCPMHYSVLLFFLLYLVYLVVLLSIPLMVNKDEYLHLLAVGTANDRTWIKNTLTERRGVVRGSVKTR